MIVRDFKGIHNSVSARSISEDSLYDAVDVDITDSGTIVERDGYVLSLSLSIDNAYSTLEGDAFVLSGGYLYAIDEGFSLNQLSESTATAFCDFGHGMFTNDGLMVKDGVITDLKAIAPIHSGDGSSITIGGDVFSKDGGDHAANVFYGPDGNQIEPEYIGADGFPPNVENVEFHQSKLWCSVSLGGETVIFYSKPFFYNVFDYEANNIIIPGKVLAMSRSNNGLVIATNNAIYLYDESLVKLADYGVVPGRSIVKLPDGNVLIHSVRGVCSIPFNNLTENKVNIPMGETCSTAVNYEHGKFRYIGLHTN